MIAVDPFTIAQEFIADTLLAATDVTDIVGQEIRPSYADDEQRDVFVTHGMVSPDGAVTLTQPVGVGPVMMTLRWQVTAWRKGFSSQGLRPLMAAILTALAGTTLRGRTVSWVDSDAVGWVVYVRYDGPALVPPEATPTGIWQHVSSYVVLNLRQKG